MMNINPMQIIGLLRGGGDAQQIAMQLIKDNNINDPTINELIEMAQNGDITGVNRIANDYFGQNGRNFGQEFNSFMSLFK